MLGRRHCIAVMGLGWCCFGWSNVGRCPGGIFAVVVVFPIAWNTTNVLYKFFVAVLFLVLGLGSILVPAGRRFCLVGVIVLLVVLVVLDGAVGAGAGIKFIFVLLLLLPLRRSHRLLTRVLLLESQLLGMQQTLCRN